MAVQAPVDVTPPGISNRHAIVIQWGGVTKIAQNDTFTADGTVGGLVIRSVQIEGTANGATLAVQGSNDGVTFENLSDIGGSALTGLSTGVLKQIREPSLWITLALTGGGASTSMMVTIFAVRQW